MNINRTIGFLVFVLFGLGFNLPSLAQNQYIKVQVTQSGVYKIDSETLSSFGFENIDQVAFFGYPGPLPQLLTAESLALQEIPSQKINDALFVFLTGPNTLEWKGNIDYNHHPYTDTLSFLIGNHEYPQRIPIIEVESPEIENQLIYQWSVVKGETTNILNSGRTWYSEPVSNGSIQSISFRKSSAIAENWKIKGKLMGQSITGGFLSLLENGTEIFRSPFSSIPNTTYGIKGEEVELESEFSPNQANVQTIELAFDSNDPNGNGYFDYLALGVPELSESIHSGVYFNHSENTIIAQSSALDIWNVSDFFSPKAFKSSSIPVIQSGKSVAFSTQNTLQFESIELVELNLRSASSWPELIIISPREFLSEAERLRIHKLTQGITAEVVVINEIYNNFGYGNRDVSAIRNFLAWHFHQGNNLKNVLFFGKGTFDYKAKLGGRPNLLPIYTSRNSLNPLTTYSSDDYFGLLDWEQGVWEESKQGDELMQIGIGRLPVINAREARIVVQKIIDYETTPSAGDWKRTITFMADDGDNNIHMRDSELLSELIHQQNSAYNLNKIYLDYFEQIYSGESQSSPQTREKLKQTLEEGTLFLNYIGHGNETTLMEEEVFRVEDLENWPNFKQLPVWITATCEFGRHDSPYLRSAAEELLIADNKGAIGLLATGRPVFSSVNYSLNEAFINTVLDTENSAFQDLGTIFKKTKNNSLNGSLNRNFSLLGDPSMRLARPNYRAEIISFKNKEGLELESLPALSEIYFEGHIVNQNQSLESGFQGKFSLEIKSPVDTVITLGDESNPREFNKEENNLFVGSGSVENGIFRGKFIIPEGIEEPFNQTFIRLFAEDTLSNREAMGSAKITLGGQGNPVPADEEGPLIEVSVEEQEKGPWVFPSQSLMMEFTLSDSSGIDITGLFPEKNLQITINGSKTIILNGRFSNIGSDYKSGKVQLWANELKEGLNTFEIQAFDLVGNQSVLSFEVQVEGSSKTQILKHKVYPNPASVASQFEIRHNRPGETLNLSIQIINLSGQILFSNSYRLVEAEGMITDLTWIFFQNQTKYPAKGTYIYKLTLVSEKDGTSDSASGKIVIE